MYLLISQQKGQGFYKYKYGVQLRLRYYSLLTFYQLLTFVMAKAEFKL